ncbi:erythrocyte binding protein-like [Hordeum vulgare]|nr:erythrocyte binding protein-like [Hordeum vulgare]
MAAEGGRQGPGPALGRSRVLNREGLDSILPMVVANTSKWGPTKILSASIPTTELSATAIALHVLTLFSGLLPPFSEFFDVVLEHYQIHALHIDPESVLLLLSFAFLSEAFLGVPPLVALLRHFFSLQLTMPDQRSECMYL